MSSRVRWKSARFVPLGIVQSLLAGQGLDENRWSVDGPSECLVPVGRPGPFRTAVRGSAAVDRMTGSAERHSTTCIEFRPGAGLWTIVSFQDDAARSEWLEPVKAAFRLLADSGFGGERSRGWGYAEAPEFIEGVLPDMIVGNAGGGSEPPVREPEPDPEPQKEPEPAPVPEIDPPANPDVPTVPDPDMPPEPNPDVPPAPEPDLPPVTASLEAPAETAPATLSTAPPPAAPEPAGAGQAHWLLSLFTPAASDSVDWTRGNYTVLARGGRIESRVKSGELKKQLPMVAEGSVVIASSAPRGSAPDVAPDGFAHPVFRAGFALAIPLPEVG
jgi:hypothetical protein